MTTDERRSGLRLLGLRAFGLVLRLLFGRRCFLRFGLFTQLHCANEQAGKQASAQQGFPKKHPGRREARRSEEHTSELQSLTNLVCRLLLEKKKKKKK